MVNVIEEPTYVSPTSLRDVVERWLADDGSQAVLEFTEGKLTAVGATRANVVLSGSFNPLHDGHEKLLAAVSAAPPGALGAFEIGVTNADKGTLDVDEIMRRLEQFSRQAVCLLTKTPFSSIRLAPSRASPLSSAPTPPPDSSIPSTPEVPRLWPDPWKTFATTTVISSSPVASIAPPANSFVLSPSSPPPVRSPPAVSSESSQSSASTSPAPTFAPRA